MEAEERMQRYSQKNEQTRTHFHWEAIAIALQMALQMALQWLLKYETMHDQHYISLLGKSKQMSKIKTFSQIQNSKYIRDEICFLINIDI